MAAEEVQREYNLGDPELAQFTSNLVSDMTRDIIKFTEFGIIAADVTAMQVIGNQFEVFPSDEMFEGEVVIATDAKNEKIVLLKESLRNMILRVEMKWGVDSGQYKRLGIKGMNNMGDDKLLYTGRRVHTVMTEYLLDLAAEGLTQVMLDALAALNEAFEVAKNTQHDKINERDVKRVERIRLGNELYSFVSKYCDIGKRIWFKVDPAKYDDYVIYPSTTQMPGKVQGMGYDVPTHTCSWDAAPFADDYQLERKAQSDPEWGVVYEGADTSVVDIPLAVGIYLYRCRGHNTNGYGAWSDELLVDLTV